MTNREIRRKVQKRLGKKKVRQIQTKLKKLGLYSIRIDGIYGKVTMQGIAQFQKTHGLDVDGIYGKDTKRKLFGVNKVVVQNKLRGEKSMWLSIAKNELGTKEYRGKVRSNKAIEKYHDIAGIGWAKDDVPWCGSFVAYVMDTAGFKIVRYSARAKSWLNFGKSVDRPVLGAIAIKSRGLHPAIKPIRKGDRKGSGHVGFVVGESSDGKYIYLLGGNQGDAVNVRRYPTNVFLDFRVPNKTVVYGKLPILTGKRPYIISES